MPRHGLAAGAGPAAPRAGGPVRLGLPDPAQGRRCRARRPVGPEHDFTDLHAWAEVYLPGAGWVGLDPTSGLLAGEGHIPLACAADPVTAAPLTGSYSWNKDEQSGEHDTCKTEFSYHMSVPRIHEDPRVTKPYTEEQWQAIDALGHEIDERPPRGGRAPDDGRRADLRLDRRHGRRRVEHRRAR